MYRYFLEVAYKGTNFSGFQTQINANTIQQEIENAFQKIFRAPISLTGSSRTDAGVHALQNFFHFDVDTEFPVQKLYNLNAVLPADIVIKNIYPVSEKAHCRFNATAREYKYFISTHKDPFIQEYAYYYPYSLQLDLLQQAATIVQNQSDFMAFSKHHTQVNNFLCTIYFSQWLATEKGWEYHVKANRFLRGMVKGLVGTMLQVGRGKITIHEFENIFKQKDSTLTDFSVPSKGLFLLTVHYPSDIISDKKA